MKITIDETVFNKAIFLGKIQVAEWLLESGCPTNENAYIQNFNIEILDWLKKNNIKISSSCLSKVIEKNQDDKVISWFLDNGAVINKDSILSCISSGLNTLYKNFIDISKLFPSVEDFKQAILSENIEILTYLDKINCEWNEDLIELAMKHKKKNSIKWLVLNNKL